MCDAEITRYHAFNDGVYTKKVCNVYTPPPPTNLKNINCLKYS